MGSSGEHHSIWMQIHTDYSHCPHHDDDDGDGDDGDDGDADSDHHDHDGDGDHAQSGKQGECGAHWMLWPHYCNNGTAL